MVFQKWQKQFLMSLIMIESQRSNTDYIPNISSDVNGIPKSIGSETKN